ncbi:hypothetical protein LCGC14_0390080 [marine sediment metagenome]|uniref:DOD-type homing endonuclease domain-containing protein n=1 Tax=marine sediment metagenome TaxID=412755 RepID=A0A0F9VLX4_9ZZZZ
MSKTGIEKFLSNRGTTNVASNHMSKVVSQYRREVMQDEVFRGDFREKGSTGYDLPRGYEDNIKTSAGNVLSNYSGFRKDAQVSPGSGTGAGAGSYRGSGGSLRQIPEIYSPLWLNSNLNLPRDRATINAWSRAFFALNPVVHNAISLHSTYPISKLNIKCKDPKIQAFFEDMVEETDLMNICVQMAQEYWLLGETFVYGELDERSAKWSRFLIQNPDYMVVKHSVVAGEPILSLRPDENLKTIVTSNRPSDVQQRQRLDQSIIEHVKRGENIPLSNFYASHLARRISPYETRGTGLVVCCFRHLMLFDKLRECYSTDCEVLTKDGFKKITDLITTTDNLDISPNYVSGAVADDNGNLKLLTLKDNVEIACFNQETGEIEYHIPEEFHMSYYKGKMLHFKGKKVDTLVTPNHKLLVKESKGEGWTDFSLRRASELLEKKTYYKFKSHAKWNGEQRLEDIDVAGHKVPIGLYLKVLGYMASEGCVYKNYKKGRYDAKIITSQLTSNRCYEEMRETFNKFASCLNRKCGHYVGIKGSGYSKNAPKEKWEGIIHGKEIVEHFLNEIGNGEKAGSYEKRLPRWVFGLHSELLLILLQSMMQGDGTTVTSKYGTKSKLFKYSTVSKHLADDVYELAFKLGHVPTICTSVAKKTDGRVVTEYIVCWSTTNYGREPLVYTGVKKANNNGGGATVNEVDYDGVVWCFTVPTGAFITRRNDKISIHGNSKFAQADNMINPLTLVKIGGAGENYKPTPVDLEAWRQIFEECHDEETEVLTDKGFKKYDEVIEEIMVADGTTGSFHSVGARTRTGFKIACFNSDNEQLEYHAPSAAHIYDYDGEMYHIHNNKMDIKVTPNHKMWVQHKKFTGTGKGRTWKWDNWDKVRIKDMKFWDRRFRSQIKWKGNDSIKEVNVNQKNVPIELYLELLGYMISEGCLYTNNKSQNTIGVCQNITNKDGSKNPHFETMRKCAHDFAVIIDKTFSERFFKRDGAKGWDITFCGRELFNHFVNEIGSDEGYKSYNKIIPKWVLNLSPRLLKILLAAMVVGDGSNYVRPKNKDLNGFFYYTSSKQLADDVYEMVYKIGFVPTMFSRESENHHHHELYTVQWSNSNIGNKPFVNKYSIDPRTKEKKEIVSKVPYQGKVWCFTVPTGLFITRRNGKITIQGNSQYDKDFKIFTHEAVTVERVGHNAGIIDIANDITQLLKEIYIGLMIPQVLMDGGADVTYANGGVTLDVLKQRYLQFRNMLGSWLRRKVFAPISKINDFYERKEGEKVLIVPEVEWNHMSLFDAGDHIQTLVQLSQGQGPDKRVATQTVYRSLGLDWEDEVRKMKVEAIQDAINDREKVALAKIPLNELRSLGPDDAIDEPDEGLLPGETEEGAGEGGPELPELPGLGPPPGGLGGPPGGAPPEGELPEAGPPAGP